MNIGNSIGFKGLYSIKFKQTEQANKFEEFAREATKEPSTADVRRDGNKVEIDTDNPQFGQVDQILFSTIVFDAQHKGVITPVQAKSIRSDFESQKERFRAEFRA